MEFGWITRDFEGIELDWGLSEPVPAWGNLLRHAEGRLEPGTQWEYATLS